MTEANVGAAWPYGDVALAVNPAKRTQLRRAMVLAVALACVAAVLVDEHGPLKTWAKGVSRQEEVEKFAPMMRKLADAGKPDAIIWMAQHFPDTEAGRLDALIRAGSGQAAWTLAGIRAKSDKAQAERLVQVAADNGYLPAMQYAQRRPR